MRLDRISISTSLLAAGVAVACATSGGNSGGGMGGNAGAGASGSGGTGTGGIQIDAPNDGPGGSASSLVYAHTDTILFELDPTVATPQLNQKGTFDCVGNQGQDPAMTDVAVDQAGNLWGISHTQVHALELKDQAVHCQSSISLNNPADVKFYALTFAPVGVLDATKEVLVAGNTAGELWSIDDQGNLLQRGTFGAVPADDGNGHTYANAGKPWELSGDIVFLENGGSPLGFATVRDCPTPPNTSGCNDIDTLIEIDVAKVGTSSTQSVTKAVRGQIVKRAGCTDNVTGSYGSMYGIAAWGDRVYGFSRDANLVEIDTNDGSACLLSNYPNADFGGAGVTTKAVVVPPPPK